MVERSNSILGNTFFGYYTVYMFCKDVFESSFMDYASATKICCVHFFLNALKKHLFSLVQLICRSVT